jgi:hypothetical protein
MLLLRTELRRFFARRAIVWALFGALLLALIVNAVQLARSTADVTYVRVQAEQSVFDECGGRGTHAGLPVLATGNCPFLNSFAFNDSGGGGVIGPPNGGALRDAYIEQGIDRRIDVAANFSDTVRGVGIALTLLVAFFAATFVAADFGTSLATQLLFDPRRKRVYLTKTLAVAVGCFVVAAVVLVWCGLLDVAGSELGGIRGGIEGCWLEHRAGDIGRAAGASAMMAVLAFAIAAVTKRTAAAIGVLFGLVIATGFLNKNGWPRAVGRIIPVDAIWAVADGKLRANGYLGIHTMGRAVVTGLAWVVVASVLGAGWFARREIR